MDLHTVTSFRDADSSLALAVGETWLAGGTWLFSEPQVDTTGLVDLTALGWDEWEVSDGRLRLGATCTLARLVSAAESSGLRCLSVVRPCVESLVMSSKIWRSATVGGNVCLALPAGAVTSLLAGLGAVAEIRSPGGTRHQAVADLVTGVRTTTLAPGEAVRAFEVADLDATTAYRRAALTAMGRSGAVVVGRRGRDDRVVVTVTASTERPRVLDLGVEPDTATVRDAVATIGPWYDDPHGAPDWRAAQTLRCVLEVVEELT